MWASSRTGLIWVLLDWDVGMEVSGCSNKSEFQTNAGSGIIYGEIGGKTKLFNGYSTWYSFHVISQFMSDPQTSYWDAVMRVFHDEICCILESWCSRITDFQKLTGQHHHLIYNVLWWDIVYLSDGSLCLGRARRVLFWGLARNPNIKPWLSVILSMR